MFVDHETLTSFGDRVHGDLELVSTVTAQRSEYFARKALRMDAHEWNAAGGVAENERNRRLERAIAIEHLALDGDRLKQSPPGRQSC